MAAMVCVGRRLCHWTVTAIWSSPQMANGQIVSGGMSTKQDFTYGRFETRVRIDIHPTGTMSGVVLTWPRSGRWPEDGELDIYETGAAANTRTPFYSFVHYGASNQHYYFAHTADGAQWHTVATEWSAGAIQIRRTRRAS